ncbi:hypothetical protein BOX15_Mlig004798g1 [Macrostomum lignano]|uniref:Uncharacterized protein n=1 Tax=Macrostomum lignano TaxID=282301 RepID=A0A267F9U3_9PLAT|nr:hypothetical protein BOX15_Mlig004798g1 [Macrostomum lignano]
MPTTAKRSSSGGRDSDRTSLVSSGSSEITAEQPQFSPPNVTLPRWTTIYMEPLTLLFCAAFQGLSPLISQYVYFRLGSELGLNSTATAAVQPVGDSPCNASDQY